MMDSVKICGVRNPEIAEAAVQAGATHIGLVFFPPSPRFVTFEQAQKIQRAVAGKVKIVGLFVNPNDAQLFETLLTVDMLQLHGQETPQRVAEIKRFGLPVMKAIGIGSATDLDQIAAYEDVSDWLLFDARPPKNAALPGGNGLAFDWQLLANRTWQKPWMLSGGLTPQTVAEAIRITGVRAVDVSSGVETAPGIKNVKLVRDFIAATLRA